MKTESFTLDWSTKTIMVTFEDQSTKEYTDAESYLADFPDRQGDAEAVWPPVA